jgi:hypothetical protein
MPYHQHDSDTSVYLGSEKRSDHNYDYYYAAQGGLPTVIARFGSHGDYQSGLLFVKSAIKPSEDVMTQLQAMKESDDGVLALLSTATILSIEQGLLGLDLKSIEKKKPKLK